MVPKNLSSTVSKDLQSPQFRQSSMLALLLIYLQWKVMLQVAISRTAPPRLAPQLHCLTTILHIHITLSTYANPTGTIRPGKLAVAGLVSPVLTTRNCGPIEPPSAAEGTREREPGQTFHRTAYRIRAMI